MAEKGHSFGATSCIILCNWWLIPGTLASVSFQMPHGMPDAKRWTWRPTRVLLSSPHTFRALRLDVSVATLIAMCGRPSRERSHDPERRARSSSDLEERMKDMELEKTWPMMSLAEANAHLTRPGAPY